MFKYYLGRKKWKDLTPKRLILKKLITFLLLILGNFGGEVVCLIFGTTDIKGLIY